jgi:hypothetical protein
MEARGTMNEENLTQKLKSRRLWFYISSQLKKKKSAGFDSSGSVTFGKLFHFWGSG